MFCTAVITSTAGFQLLSLVRLSVRERKTEEFLSKQSKQIALLLFATAMPSHVLGVFLPLFEAKALSLCHATLVTMATACLLLLHTRGVECTTSKRPSGGIALWRLYSRLFHHSLHKWAGGKVLAGTAKTATACVCVCVCVCERCVQVLSWRTEDRG